jgi:hypothetical protein
MTTTARRTDMNHYTTTDPSEHDDVHRGYVMVGALELNIVITHEGLIVDLYDDTLGELRSTFAKTFEELAEFVRGK